MHGIYFTLFFKISLGKKLIDNVLKGKQQLEAPYWTLDMHHRPGVRHNNVVFVQ